MTAEIVLKAVGNSISQSIKEKGKNLKVQEKKLKERGKPNNSPPPGFRSIRSTKTEIFIPSKKIEFLSTGIALTTCFLLDIS